MIFDMKRRSSRHIPGASYGPLSCLTMGMRELISARESIMVSRFDGVYMVGLVFAAFCIVHDPHSRS